MGTESDYVEPPQKPWLDRHETFRFLLGMALIAASLYIGYHVLEFVGSASSVFWAWLARITA